MTDNAAPTALNLNDSEIGGSIDLRAMTDELLLAFADLGSGTAVSTLRVRAQLDDLDASAMSAYYPRRSIGGGKLYVNSPRGRGFIIVLFADDGQLLATFSGSTITAARTAATTGIGLRLLAPPDSHTAALFGTGEQAPWQARVLMQEMDLHDLRIVGRSQHKAEALAHWATSNGIPARVTDAHSAVMDADVVVTATAAYQPVFDGHSLTDGTLVVGVGSTKPYRQELDLETIRRASLIVSDSAQGATTEAGDLIHAAEHDGFDWSRVVGLEQVAADDHFAQPTDGITLFESQGLALEDVAAAWTVLERWRLRDEST
jgi:ornithine cyclodeaminase/alanine dehydrogenase-like protein (mu-crystallin family)